jgi:hypothetical protein
MLDHRSLVHRRIPLDTQRRLVWLCLLAEQIVVVENALVVLESAPAAISRRAVEKAAQRRIVVSNARTRHHLRIKQTLGLVVDWTHRSCVSRLMSG